MNSSHLRLGAAEREVLKLLRNGKEMYGLEMVNEGELLRRGTVYVYLSRMVKKGYLTDRVEDSEGLPGLPRRLYRISAMGQAALSASEHADQLMSEALAAGT